MSSARASADGLRPQSGSSKRGAQPSRVRRKPSVPKQGEGQSESRDVLVEALKAEVDSLTELRRHAVQRSTQLEREKDLLQVQCSELRPKADSLDATKEALATLQAQFHLLTEWAREEERLRKAGEEKLSTVELETRAVREELGVRISQQQGMSEQQRAMVGELEALRALTQERERDVNSTRRTMGGLLSEGKELSDENVELKRHLAEMSAQLEQEKAIRARLAADRDKALAHKQEEIASLQYKLRGLEVRMSTEVERRVRAEEREQKLASELKAVTSGDVASGEVASAAATGGSSSGVTGDSTHGDASREATGQFGVGDRNASDRYSRRSSLGSSIYGDSQGRRESWDDLRPDSINLSRSSYSSLAAS
ncbi:unnamed protein product, partial [Chrysoparadoxa australica]